jgi:hypothetical protein
MADGSKNPWLVYAGRIVPIITSRQRFALVVNGRPTLSDASILERSQDLLSRQLLLPGSGGGTGLDQQCPLRLEWFQLPQQLGAESPGGARRLASRQAALSTCLLQPLAAAQLSLSPPSPRRLRTPGEQGEQAQCIPDRHRRDIPGEDPGRAHRRSLAIAKIPGKRLLVVR